MTIHKYKLQIVDTQRIAMHANARILTVQAQDGDLYLWAEVDTSKHVEGRGIVIRGTGRPFTAWAVSYLGTVQLGGFVWHVYEDLLP